MRISVFIWILLLNVCLIPVSIADQRMDEIRQKLKEKLVEVSSSPTTLNNIKLKANSRLNVEFMTYAGDLEVRDFFRGDDIRNLALSPSGKYIAYTRGNYIFAGDLQGGFTSIRDIPSDFSFQSLLWVSDSALISQVYRQDRGVTEFNALKLSLAGGKLKVELDRTNRVDGYIVDPLIAESEKVIFARYQYNDDGSAYSNIYKVDMFVSAKEQFNKRNRLNRENKSIAQWILDKGGNPVLGAGWEGKQAVLWSRPAGKKKFIRIWVGESGSDFIPQRLSDDRKTLWALSNHGRDTLAAIEFDISTASISRVLYENPMADLQGLKFNTAIDAPVSAIYLENGKIKYQHLDSEQGASLDNIRRLFPAEEVVVVDQSATSGLSLVYSFSSSSPGSYHLCSELDVECELITLRMPWLEGIELATTHSFKITADDGVEVESFLTLPRGAKGKGSIPLIVMPHGGPIGVSDDRYYSPDVQWLAANDYAVLQVNYRGSGGYGKSFQSKGLGQFGRAIEDDIDSAVTQALRDNSVLDSTKIAAFGGSYGGYSALMATIRDPQRYKCAVSFAGVTDLTLLFNRDVVRRNSDVLQQLVNMVGDPSENMTDLMHNSPVYRFDEISRPIFLVHGSEDDIVDIEHSWRLRKMMSAKGKKVYWLALKDVGHGFTKLEDAEIFYDQLIGFLDKNLVM